MSVRSVLAALPRSASVLSLACCLVAPACDNRSSGDGSVSEVEQRSTWESPEIHPAQIFDVAPDDPRQYDGSLCDIGGPALISGNAYLAKYGCSLQARAPIGFYWNPDIGDYECRGAYLYRSEFEDEEAATACITVTPLAPLSCSTTPKNYCNTNAAPSTHHGTVQKSVSFDKSVCASAKVFARITVAVGTELKATGKGGLELFGTGCVLASSVYGKVEAQGGAQVDVDGSKCVTQSTQLSIQCGGQTWSAGQLSCNSYWEHKDSRPAKIVTKTEWPVYDICSLEINGYYYGWTKQEIRKEWVETSDHAFMEGQDVYEECTGCQPPDNATNWSTEPNCRTRRPDGTWAASYIDAYDHPISPHANVASGYCAYQCLNDADCDSSGNACYTCQSNSCAPNEAKMNAVECGGSGDDGSGSGSGSGSGDGGDGGGGDGGGGGDDGGGSGSGSGGDGSGSASGSSSGSSSSWLSKWIAI